MDFKKIIRLLLNEFIENNVRYALMGGFALGALGIPRATVDIDFLVNHNDLPKVDNIMEKNGYECVYKSENVSQYVSPLKIFGEVDFLHAFRKISIRMIEKAIEKDIFEGELKIRVLRPEDIIGLKIQAIANDEKRANREYVDIEALMEYYGTGLNWDLIKEYFLIFDQINKFDELRKIYCHAK